jgi:hypothetical protein
LRVLFLPEARKDVRIAGDAGSVNLNLGCGTYRLNGFTNVDLDQNLHPDLVADVRTLPFRDGVAEKIYAGHIIEHLWPWEVVPALLEWRRVMKAGAVLYIVFPDMHKAAFAYVKGQIPWNDYAGAALGAAGIQAPWFTGNAVLDSHKTPCSVASVRDWLVHANFRDAREVEVTPYTPAYPAWQSIIEAWV